MLRRTFLGTALLSTLLLALAATAWTQGKPPVKVALVAATSGGSALSGEAIKRGLTIAIDEINARGGVLGGSKIELVIRDEEGNSSKGVTAARDVIEREKAVAVFGGLHSPVGLAMLPVFHELKVPYVGTWAAATNITRNGRTPNFMFRVSANDDIVDHFLAKHVVEKLGKKKPGVILENTPWGASNQEGLTKWLGKLGAPAVGYEKFNWKDPDMSPPESVVFVQTYSFFGKQNDVGERVIAALKAKYGLKGPEDILAPVGTANAYDAMHLVGLAIDKAGAADGAKVRDALESLGEYKGLIKTYKRPFTPEEHDALTESDYVLVTWRQGKIVPVSMK